MEQAFLKINPADSVVVCLQPMKQGDVISVDGRDITLLQDTPAGHKILLTDKAEGEDIIKYGYPIGHARQALKAGTWVNENNLKILDAIPLADVMAGWGNTAQRTNAKGDVAYYLCPWHDDHDPSLTVERKTRDGATAPMFKC